ncbi:MAG TPA: acyloxyacyl hydrolase, partial [Gemmatimonadaceae bacterium]|nr:acyloxyacyl hydrolase [Gemmatimonadaceae bacterium]
AATVDAIPLAVVTNNPYYTDRVVAHAISRRGERVDVLEQTGRGPVYGFGASPLGLELFGPRMRVVRPYFAAAAGFLWFTRNTPEPEARRLNATFELGAGLRVAHGERHALLLGWKFHHLSNAWTAPYNPGLDGNVFYLGVVRRR